MKNIHIIPTDKARLYMRQGKLYDNRKTMHIPDGTQIPQHIYITSDEEIRIGDYFYDEHFTKAIKYGDDFDRNPNDFDNTRKIIFTTDPKLIADGVQAIDDEFLEWFVKNQNCEFVEVSSLGMCNPDTNECFHYKWEYDLPQEEPKQSKWDNLHKELDDALENMSEADWLMLTQKYKWGHHNQEVLSGGAKYVFGTAKGEYTIGNTSPNTAKGEYTLAIGYNPETTNKPEGHHSIVIGNGLTTTEPYQLLVDRNGIKIDKIMTIEEYELLSQVLKSINDIKF
jgi:hypothetical protein